MSGPQTQPLVQCSSPQEAVRALVERARVVGVEEVTLAGAWGRVLAERVLADRPSPSCDVSAMDGYAVRLADLARGELPVTAEVRIGSRPPEMRPGGVVRIVTGAPVPPGAEAVVKREDVEELEQAIRVGVGAATVRAGQNIRRRGENAGAGSEVTAAGREITAPLASALASFGCVRPRVFRRVRVGVLTTGDEVLDASETPNEWQLRDGNGPAISAMLGARGWIEVAAPQRRRDEPAEIRAGAAELLKQCDALVLSGGVSMGDRDFVPSVLRGLGATIVFHRVPQRPGKPVLGAVTADGKPIFGLPGNPLSVMVTCRRIVVPVLERVGGFAKETPPAAVRLRATGKPTDLWWHRPVRLVGAGEAELAETASSGDVAGAAGSDGFVEVPPGETGEGPWPYYAW